MGQITVFSGLERRRRWNDERKRALVLASLEPGAVIAEIARAADIRPSQIYRWRRDFGGKVQSTAFASVSVTPERRDETRSSSAIVIELGGAVVRVAADAPAKLVATVLRSLAR